MIFAYPSESLLLAALAAYKAAPEDVSVLARLREAVRGFASELASLPGSAKEGVAAQKGFELLRTLWESGYPDLEAEASDRQLAEVYKGKGWQGLLATMAVIPAWQWSDSPILEKVPMWLWSIFSSYVFYSPQGFSAVGQADAYANHYLMRLEELARLTEANRGSSAVRSALDSYLKSSSCIPLYFVSGSLKRHYQLRARILALLNDTVRQEPLPAYSAEGRKLRIGFINRHFAPQTESYTTLPMFEHLDPDRFEVLLFVHLKSDTPLENYARSRVSDFRLLPGSIEEQVQVLKDAMLDVAVYATNVTAVYHEVTRLALFRVAPLQMVNNSSCTTTGMSEIDLYVSGTLTESKEAADHFVERLGLVPGPAHAFNYEMDKQAPTVSIVRSDLGIPADAFVFATAANYFKIIPEMQLSWARLLQSVPNSYLLVHPFNPNWSSQYPIKRFCSDFDSVLRAHGVDGKRLIVSSTKFPSRTDVKELLRVGDVYLDTYPFGGVNSLVDPLEIGIPCVTWEGTTFRSRMGSALLRALGLEELVAGDESNYLALCRRLASDGAWRESLTTRIRAEMEKNPIFLDSLAASDAFGILVETAYAEMSELGAKAFRARRDPIILGCAIDAAEAERQATDAIAQARLEEACTHARMLLAINPNGSRARHLLGKALLLQEKTERALIYLLAALNGSEGDALLWEDVAIALKKAGRMDEALKALEASLRLDQARLDGWLLLGRWAKEVGHAEMHKEVCEVARQLAPSDPRVASL